MRRLVPLGLVVLVIATAPVLAHGNALDVDTQTTATGRVTIEVLTVVTDGFVALHAANGSDIGPVVGVTDPGEGPVHTDLTVALEDTYWQSITNHTTLYAVLHRNEGDESFDPATDPIQESAAGEPVAARFTLGKTDTNRSLVLAAADHAHEVNTSRVTVRRVSLAHDGYLVIRANDGGTPGPIVGRTALLAGTHRAVTVAIDEHFYAHRDERFSVWAVLHRANGDGTFDPAADPPVTVGGAPVQTQLSLHRTDEIDSHEHGTATPTVTPEGHAATAHPTETSTPSPTPSTATTTPSRASPTDRSPPTTGQAPGFTLGLGLLSLLAAGWLLRRAA